MFDILNAILYIIDFVFFVRYNEKMFEKSKHKIPNKIFILLFIFLILFLKSYISIIYITIFSLILCIFMYKNTAKKFFLYACLLAISIYWDSLFFVIILNCTKEITAILLFFLYHVGFDLIIYIIGFFREKECINETKLNMKITAILSSIPLFEIIWYISIEYYFKITMTSQELDTIIYHVFFPVWTNFIILNILFCYLYDQLQKKQRELKNQIILEQQLQIQIKHFKEISQIQQETRSMKHDINNIIQSIQVLLDTKKYKEMQKLLKYIIKRTNKINEIIQTGNPIIDSIINYKMFQAQENNIKLNIINEIPNNIDANYEIILTIIGNLLDNAIEATMNLEKNDRIINFYLKYINKSLLIKIENNYNKNNYQNNKTTKLDKKNHGLGLNNVKRCVEQLNGVIKIEANKTFLVEIILYKLK